MTPYDEAESAGRDDPAQSNLVVRIARAVVRPFTALARGWRQSLQVRALITTIVLAAVVVALVGTILQRQIVDGILDTKAQSAVAEASRGFDSAQRTLELGRTADVGATEAARALLGPFVKQYGGQSGGGSFEVMVLGTPGPGQSATGFPTLSTGAILDRSITPALRSAVLASGAAFRTYGEILYVDRPAEPAVLVGKLLHARDGTGYELYYLFPLTQEQDTIAVVQRTLFTGSGLLLLLIGLVAWIVVRRTVSPVRHAARIAERLSAGGLEERMHVRGEDDMARLATSFNRMATSLQRQIKQLEDLSRMQQRFASDVSHELRTPLTTVRMAADVLYDARGQLDPPAARAAELLQNELDRFEHLLGELLEISRFDAGAAILDPELIDCRDLVRGVAAAAEPLARRVDTELVLHVPPDPCVAEVDPRRIARILRNLVENAIEHGESRPVEIAVASDESTVAFTVRDHGIGMEPGEVASVFNRFWRADPSRKRTIGGTGLGLAIALEDTQLHDGWLQAWARPGQGSQFRLTLPRARGGSVETSPLPMTPADRLVTERPALLWSGSTTPADPGPDSGRVGAGSSHG